MFAKIPTHTFLLLIPVLVLAGVGITPAGWTQPVGGDAASLALGQAAFVTWARDHALVIKTTDPAAPSADLGPAKALIGDARVVMLGETERDAHEELQLNHRLVKYMVQQLGFTVLALEENIASSDRINAYLLKGDGDPEEILSGLSEWQTWNNEEFLSLLKWLRAYDKDPAHKRKVRVYGIDVLDPYASMVKVKAYLDRVDPDYAVFLDKGPVDFRSLKTDSWLQLAARYSKMPVSHQSALHLYMNGLTARFEERRSEYITKSSEADYSRALREATAAARANDFFISRAGDNLVETTNIRITAMVDNVTWLLNEEAKGERLMIWAHNIHVSRDYIGIDIPGSAMIASSYPVGRFLSTELGDKLVSIGHSVNRRAYADSVFVPPLASSFDGALVEVGKPLYLLNLRSVPSGGEAADWINRQNSMRVLGGVTRLVPAKAYDAVVFFDKVTPAVPTAAARARLEGMGAAYLSTRATF
ncbi:MAG TPA: erythromycin esterase family protein [bacterium]|nr:erythromycin esterase family protein [bacterium]